MKLFINAPNRILNASKILDKIRWKKKRTPIYPKPFFWSPVIWLIITTNNVIVTNHVFILQDLNCLQIQVKVFITFLYISKFI